MRRANSAVCAAGLCLSVAVGAQAYVAIVNKTDYQEMHVVPAPGKVAIDGDLKDWDLSGVISLCLDEASRSIMSVAGAYMYDQEAFYVGGRVKDPTPMMNAHDFAGNLGLVWDADAIQLRLISNPAVKSRHSIQNMYASMGDNEKYVCHLTLWYSTKDQKPGLYICYTLKFADGQLNPPGVEAAYKQDPDGKGYTFEYRIPWNVLRADKPWKDGDTVQTQWQVHWGDDRGEKVRAGMTDVRTQESGDLGYMGPASWGLAVVHGKGNLKLAKQERIGRPEGHVAIAFELKQAAKASLAVTDKDGRIIRTCFGAEPMEAGKHTYPWDGLDDYDRPVPAGDYRWKLLVVDGYRQEYICNVGSSGNPPYQNDAGTGGWAGDYAWPWYVEAEDDLVVLGTGGGEAAPTTIGVTLDGRKLWGAPWGDKGCWVLHKGVGYYTSYDGGTLSRFDARKGKLQFFADGQSQKLLMQGDQPVKALWTGIAMADGALVLANPDDSMLYRVSPETGAVMDRLPLGGRPTGGLAVGPKGELYAVVADRIGIYDLKKKSFKPLTDPLPTGTAPDGTSQSTKGIACDADGNLYACVWGQAMQVWKFSSSGKLLQKIGKEGGRPMPGTFDPAGMYKPYDVAVDRNGRVWVCEFDEHPKRYSVWNPDGTLWKEFFGSIIYSTCASIDPHRTEEIYAGRVCYRVDYDTPPTGKTDAEAGVPPGASRDPLPAAKASWRVDRTLPGNIKWEIPPAKDGGKPLLFTFPTSPEGQLGAVFTTIRDRRFVWMASPHRYAVHEIVGDALVPRLYLTSGWMTDNPMNWHDANNDGRFQTDETFAHVGGEPSRTRRYTRMDPNMNLYRFDGVTWANQGGDRTTNAYRIERVRFTGFNAQGAPTWADFDKPDVVATDPDGGAVSDFMVDAEGRVFVLVSGGTLPRGKRAQGSGHRVVGFDAKGSKMWEYHNVHCAFAWTSDAYTPGYVVGAFRVMESSTKRLFGITGYYGQYFLLDKETGLFVAAVGQDQRTPYIMDHTFVHTENINGTIWTHPKSGAIYFAGGDADCRIWELNGLKDLDVREGQVKVSAAQFAQAGKNADQAELAQRAAMGLLRELKLKKLVNAAANGDYSEWTGVPPQTILMSDQRSAMAQVGYDEQRLWVRFQVNDASPLRNQAPDYRNLFKSGDALDIQVCTDTAKRPVHGQNQQEMRVGDARILVTRTHEDKMIATIIRYRTADKDKPLQHEYASPVWKETVDEVRELNDLPMHCAAGKDDYVVEVGIPWTMIGVKSEAGLKLRGDVGVIYGNEGGTRNAIRYMWSDKSAEVSINNDVPSEMRMHPNDLGLWIVE